jgi:thioredoxin 1
MDFARRFPPSLVACAVLSLLAAGAAASPQSEPFSEDRFRALQEEGALVLVDVAADWCSTCAKQGKVLTSYREARPEVPLHVLRVDFDRQKEWVKHFRAPRQATLILFRGDERVWFSVAETDESTIFAAIDGAAGPP